MIRLGKSTVDKDAFVPSAKLTALTGLFTFIKAAIDKRKAKEIEQQKQQFQFMKFYLPLLQKERELIQRQTQFEAGQKTELAGIKQERAQFEATATQSALEFQARHKLALQTSEVNISKINAQIEQWRSTNLLSEKQFSLEGQKFESQKANTLFDQQQQVITSLQTTLAEKNRNIRHTESLTSAEGIAAREEAGRDDRAEQVRLTQVQAGLVTNFRQNEEVLRSYQEELNKVESKLDKEKLAIDTVRLAQRMLIDHAQLVDIAQAKGDPVPQVPDVLTIYRDTSWFKDIFGIGREEFGVTPVVPTPKQSPAQAVLQAPKSAARVREVQNAKDAVKRVYGKVDVPEEIITGLRTKFTEEEVQRIIDTPTKKVIQSKRQKAEKSEVAPARASNEALLAEIKSLRTITNINKRLEVFVLLTKPGSGHHQRLKKAGFTDLQIEFIATEMIKD